MPNISEVGDVILIRQAKVCNVSLSFKKFVISYPAGRNMEWLRLSAKPLGDRVSYSPQFKDSEIYITCLQCAVEMLFWEKGC